MKNYFHRLIVPITFLIASMPINKGFTQSTDSTAISIQKADFRGQRPQKATIAALSASNKGVVVLYISGGGQTLIEETEGNMRGMIRSGYTRLGLILAGSFPNEKTPTIVIFSNGQVYATLEDAKADASTSTDVYKLVRDAYNEDIKPKQTKKEKHIKDN